MTNQLLKVKTIGETDIFVDADGTFSAVIGGDLRKRRSLRALEKLIPGQNARIKCFGVASYNKEAPTFDMEIVAFDGNRRYRTATNNVVSFTGEDGPYLDDPELRAEIEELIDRWDHSASAFHVEYQQLLRRGRRPTQEDLDRAREAAKETA